MTGGTVSGRESLQGNGRLIGGESEFTCIVLGGTNSTGGGSSEFIGPLSEYLSLRGIRVDILSDYSFLNGHYTERFEELAKGSVLGVLILDNAGPEELYQFGFLRGCGKFVLALGKDVAGACEAKGLRYSEDSETRDFPSEESGAVAIGNKFIMRHLPLPVRTGWEAFSNESAEAEFLRCLGEELPGVIENYILDSFDEEHSYAPEDTEDLHGQVLRLSRYFSEREGFGLPELDTLYESLLSWEERTGKGAPLRMRSCLASLYSWLSECAVDEGIIILSMDRCVSLYEQILESDKQDALAGIAAKKLADLHVLRLSPENEPDDLEKAVGLYRRALGIFSREIYPREFTSVSNNLGVALNSLYSRTGEQGYARDAAESLEGCLPRGVFINSEPDLALVNVNLGSAYASLAVHENPGENYLRAAGAFEDALGLYGDPAVNASMRASLGSIYKTLGDMEAEADNPDGAIEFYDRALLHYQDETAGGVHASNGRKLGDAFGRLYKKGGDVTDLRKAIAAYSASLSAAAHAGEGGYGDIPQILVSLYSELADMLETSGDYEGAIEGVKGLLSVIDPAVIPLEYALAQVRMGGLYTSLAGIEERELNTELAVDSYKEALSLIDDDTYHELQKELRGLAGGLLTGLASAETDELNKKIGFYMEALDFLKPEEHPREFARAKKGLGDVYMSIYLSTSEIGLLPLAAQAFREVLRVFDGQQYAEEYTEAEASLREAENLIAVLEKAEAGAAQDMSGTEEIPSERPFLTIVKDEEPREASESCSVSGEEQVPVYERDADQEEPNLIAARCEGLLKTVSKEDSPAEYASLKLALGRAYSEIGDRAEDAKTSHFRKALKAFEESLAVYNTGGSPREYASAAAAAAYSWMRIAEQTGDVRGFERAIASYGEALSVLTAGNAPGEWAAVKENLGNIHRALAEIRGNPGDYRKALAEYKDALTVFTSEDHLQDYGRIQKKIGFIHGVLAGLEDSGPDYARAVEAFSGALRAYGPASYPAEYVEIHKLLGIALAGIARRENSHEHYMRAIESWGKAVGDSGADLSPKDFALIMKNTGAAYESLYGFSGDPSDLRSAAASYEGALRYYTYKLMPSEYASITSALGAIYKRLAESEDAASNCRKAVKCYEGTLRVYTLNEYPLEFAATQNNIGIIYRTLAELEDKGRNCKRAINAYREALKVYTEKGHPAQYGSTKNNMGTAFMTLAEVEDRVAYCRMAVNAFEDALRVRTVQSYPLQFAATQNNLGVVYRMLSESEERARNCRKAITSYENALMIYTIDRFPLQYATTQNNIGGACTTLAEEEDRTRNCDKAAAAYQEALKVFTRNAYPAQYAIVKSNLELLTEFSGKDISSAAS